MKEAKEDYSAYKEHSAGRQNDMSDDEYRKLREEERARARLKKIEKKEKQLAEKKAREEYLANARMNNVVRGVTSDTLIKDTQEQAPDIDIHEIVVDTERNDKYSQDIYEPDYNAHNEDTFELAYDDIDNNDYYPDNESHVEDIQPDYMSNDYMSDDEVTGAAPEDVTGYVESSYAVSYTHLTLPTIA